ncbi:cysteine desulfurase [Quercus suber]|uniref:Cysteine desulfurase n=1 Tax=Quercus suber TaxID=58331 RepID=A0AAW0KVL5_QUESU
MASKLLASTLRQTLLSKFATAHHVRPLSTAAAVAADYHEDTEGITMKGVKISGRPLYLDVQATSPVDPRVLDAMLPFYISRYGNPHSRTHLFGWESENAVEAARSQVASLIGASPKEIIFTSGATESNNISVKGVLHFYKDKKRHVITTQTEHKRRPRIRVEPQMNGGGQERGLRSGTVPTPLVVGMGAACELAKMEMQYDEKRIKSLQERLLNGVREKLDGVVVNGSEERRYAGNMNLSFAYVEGESLLMGLKEVAVSSGSACTSASLEPSYVLRALGVDEDMAHTSIRFGIGRFTTEAEIDRAVELTVHQVEKLREMSPLYEMVKEGINIKDIQWSQH